MRAPLLAAAALAAVSAGAPAVAFDPTGEMVFRSTGSMSASAAFDAQQVVGPVVNMARDEEGAWSGDLAGENLGLTVSPSRISGANVNLAISTKDGGTSVEGLFFGRRVRLELNGRNFHGRLGRCSFDMVRKSPALFSGDVGCIGARGAFPVTGKASIALTGEASRASPPQPQFALGLIAILPG